MFNQQRSHGNNANQQQPQQGRGGYPNQQNQQQGYRPGLPEAMITSNGYYNRNTSEKCILTGDYPVISCVLNGEAGVLPLPKNAMERLMVMLPNLPLIAPQEQFDEISKLLAKIAKKNKLTVEYEEIWNKAGYQIAKPAPNAREQEMSDLRSDMRDLCNAMKTLTKKKDGSDKKDGLKLTFDSDDDEDEEGDEENADEDGEDDDDGDDDIGGFSDKEKTPNLAEKKKLRKGEAITKKTPVLKEPTPKKGPKRGRRASV